MLVDTKPNRKNNKPRWMVLGAIGLFLVTKGKALLPLLKFGKFGGAIVTMIASIGAYALIAPVEFAVGIVAMLFVHELGHVIAAKQKGLPVSAPVFIPFLGAFINMKRHPQDAATEAYMAIGGPVLGTAGAFVAFVIGYYGNYPVLVAVANIGFFLNLINLLPIHPLDGGRIATAVTRWLWLLGLIGGLVVVIYLRSFLFFIIWAMFAWDLYKKYVKYRGAGEKLSYRKTVEVPVAHLLEQGILIPGEEHKRELPYVTYSDLEGGQKVEVYWDGLGLHDSVRLPVQGLIKKVYVDGIVHDAKPVVDKIIVSYTIEYETYLNDKYYEVPVALRWIYGASYGLLAAFLMVMVYIVKDILDGYMA